MPAQKHEKLFVLSERSSLIGQGPAYTNLFALPQTDEGEIQRSKPLVLGDRLQTATEISN